MSVFDDAIAAGLGSIRTLAGDAITYHAGAVDIEIASAVEGATTYEREDESGILVAARAVDFLVAVADLVDDDDNAIDPTPGHWIEKASQPGHRFELLPVAAGKCFRYADPNRTEYRLHTKQTAAA